MDGFLTADSGLTEKELCEVDGVPVVEVLVVDVVPGSDAGVAVDSIAKEARVWPF